MRPVPIESHHVWPLGYHGPDVPANRAPLCANAHSDTHYLLDALLRTRQPTLDGAKRALPDGYLRSFGLVERRLAGLGFTQIHAYGDQLARQRATAVNPPVSG